MSTFITVSAKLQYSFFRPVALWAPLLACSGSDLEIRRLDTRAYSHQVVDDCSNELWLSLRELVFRLLSAIQIPANPPKNNIDKNNFGSLLKVRAALQLLLSILLLLLWSIPVPTISLALFLLPLLHLILILSL